MSEPRRYDPRHYEPDDDTPYGLGADDAPPPPPPEPTPEPEPIDPSLGEGPKSHKKPRRADYRKVKTDPRYVDKLLEPKPKPKRPQTPWPDLPWWLIAEAFALVGVVLGAVPIVQAVHKVKTGATTGVFIGLMLVAAAIVQTAASAAILAVVGGWLNVEYGTPRQSIIKLAAVSLFAVGLVIALLSVGGPVAAPFAAFPVAAALAALFRLGLTGTLVSLVGFGLAGAGTAMVLFIGAVLFFR